MPAFVAGQIQRLRGLQASLLHDQDEDQRLYSSLGLPAAEDRTSRSLQRYEQSCRRALGWAHGELKRLQAEPKSESEPRPRTRPQPMPEPVPVPVPSRAASAPREEPRPERSKPPVRRDVERLLEDKSRPQLCAELDFPMIPPPTAASPTAPPRPPTAGTRA